MIINPDDNPRTIGDKIWGLVKELVIVVVGALIIAGPGRGKLV